MKSGPGATATALLLMACVVLAAPLAWAQADTTRYPVDDPADIKAGAFFVEYSGLVVPNPSFEAEEARVMGGPERQAEFATAASAMETNLLGRELMRGLDAVRSAALSIRVLRALFREDEAFYQQVGAARHVVRMRDGSERSLPLVNAWRLQRGLARAAARELSTRQGAPQLAGDYVAQAEGAGCPVETGPVQVIQRGRAVEVVRDGRLLAAGVVGESEVVAIANEQRFATITKGPDGARIEAPDRASEIYLGGFGTGDIALFGSNFKSCSLTLARVR
jgi:hypothetical protein